MLQHVRPAPSFVDSAPPSLLPYTKRDNTQGGTVVNHDASFKADVLINGQTIEAVGADLEVRLQQYKIYRDLMPY